METNSVTAKVMQAILDVQIFNWAECLDGEPSIWHQIGLWINRNIESLDNYRAFRNLDQFAKTIANVFPQAVSRLAEMGYLVYWGKGVAPDHGDKQNPTHFITIDPQYSYNGISAEMADRERLANIPKRAIQGFERQLRFKYPDDLRRLSGPMKIMHKQLGVFEPLK